MGAININASKVDDVDRFWSGLRKRVEENTGVWFIPNITRIEIYDHVSIRREFSLGDGGPAHDVDINLIADTRFPPYGQDSGIAWASANGASNILHGNSWNK